MRRMNELMSFSLVFAVLLPALSVFLIRQSSSSRSAGRVGATLSGSSFLLALAIFAWVASGETASTTFGPAGLEIGLVADRVTASLLLLVTGVSCLVQAFGSRYLHGDLRIRRFFAGAGLLTAASSAMVVSASLVTLALAWSASGLAVIALLGMYPGLPGADEGRRRAIRAFIGGDLALWVAVIWTSLRWDGMALSGPGDAIALPAGSLEIALVACLLVIAALSRSAQLPFKSWLPATVSVPTPVSALLHAGVVNAGGVLLIKTSGVFGASELATHLAFAAGASTAIYGIALMLSKPDVKGALAHSTTGQMGFMIMTCGLGAWVATIFHLIAHSMYKASLFLGSGSALTAESRRQRAPRVEANGRSRPAIALASLGLTALPLALFTALLYPDPSATSIALLAFAWATFAWLTHGWLYRNPGPMGTAAALGMLALAAGAYVAFLGLATGFLSAELGEAGSAAVSPLWLLIFIPAGMLALVLKSASGGILEDWRKTLYVALLNSSQVRTSTVGRQVRERSPLRRPGALLPRSQGARS